MSKLGKKNRRSSIKICKQQERLRFYSVISKMLDYNLSINYNFHKCYSLLRRTEW